jgi:hypothetical protein
MPGSMRPHGRARTSLQLPCALVFAGWLAFPAPAQASPEESLRAESLFRSGKEAYQRGEFSSACPRLAESQRLEPAGGTLLALALCYEGWGKNATAWALFQQAEAVARAQGRLDRVAIARRRAKALEPGLSFVTVELAPDVPATVEVALDDLEVGAAAIGTPTAVDAGEHRIEARHGGVTYFTKTLALGARDDVVVAIPAPPPAMFAHEHPPVGRTECGARELVRRRRRDRYRRRPLLAFRARFRPWQRAARGSRRGIPTRGSSRGLGCILEWRSTTSARARPKPAPHRGGARVPRR